MQRIVPGRSTLLRLGILLALPIFLVLVLAVSHAQATSYYFSSSASCPGSGTSGAPYCALTSANSIDFNPGDQMLLNRGSLWTGQQITLSDSDDGSSVSWVTMDAYGSGARPILDWTKEAGQRLLLATNIDYWNIKNLVVRESQIGMLFDYTTIGHQGLHLENIYFHDMYYDPSDGAVYDGAAMYVAANGSPPSGTNFYINDVWFLDLEAKNTAYAPGLAYGDPACPDDDCDTGDPIQNVVIKNNYFHDLEGATSVQDIAGLTIVDSQFVNMPTVHHTNGTTNLFFWHTSDATVSNNVFDRVPDTDSFDQTHVDLEGFTSNADFRHNYFTDAAGNAIEFQLWRSSSYLTGIDIDGNVFNRNSWDTPTTYNGAIGLIPSCLISPSGTVSNSLYYEPDGLFITNGCSHSLTLSSNTDAGSSASFAISGKDFSDVQGTGNWRYRYSNDAGANWADLGYFDASWDSQLNDRWQINSGTTYPWVTRFRMHPDGVGSHYVAREWTAPSAGTVNIRSRVLKAISGGNGVNARITKNGTALWGWTLIGGSDEVGVAANLSSVSVAAGDKIRFEIDGNGDGSYDWASWMPMITFVSDGGGGGGTSFVTGVTTNGQLRNDFGSDVGMKITVGASAITLTEIGRYFVTGNSGTHTLKVTRASDGALLGSVSINMGAGTPDALGYKYATLGTPVTLAASTAYYITSLEANGGDQWYGNTVLPSLSSTSVASINSGIYWWDSTWTAYGGASDSYVPMNFKYTTTGSSSSFVTGVTTNGQLRNDFGSDVGMKITVGASAITLTEIGRYFVTGNSGTHTLKVTRASDGALLGSVSINMGAGTPDALGYKYATLGTPVTLAASTAYYITSLEANGGDQWYGNTVLPSLSSTSVASINSGIYWWNSTWNVFGGAGDSYVPMNFKYQ